MSDEQKPRFSGIACGDHGCQTISGEAAEALWAEAMRQKADRTARMPDEATALRLLTDAYRRLQELGWKETAYAPKKLDAIEMIEVGSSGVHSGYRDEHGFWIVDDDIWPSRPVLYRTPLPKGAVSGVAVSSGSTREEPNT